MPDINALLREREKVVLEQRALNDKVLAEKRAYTAEEDERYGKLDAEFERIDKEIAEAKKDEERRMKLAAREAMLKAKPDIQAKPDPDEPADHKIEARGNYRSQPWYQEAFRRYLQRGIKGVSDAEMRALQADQDTVGGFVVAPEQFVNELIIYKNDLVFARQYGRVIKLTRAASLGAPALETDPADSNWTSEIRTGAEDSSMSFTKRHLTPHPLAKRIKVSNTLIRLSAVPIEALVRERLAYKFAITECKAFLQGTGANQPLGIFTASGSGISTGRDVSTGNTTTEIKADNLIECVYTLKAQYRRNARWVFHRSALKQIRKLKDGEGNYLWQSGLAANRPATILDLPYDESEYAPSTFTSGLYVGAVGDWSTYWIVDALDMTVQVLDQLYAETNQTGYIGRQETDGQCVDENAWVRVKLG